MKHILLIAFLAACGHHPEPASPINIDLAAKRAEMLGYLAEYTERGVFPTDEHGLPLSVFEDSHGVRCPMAELIYRSGHADLVEAVVATNNTLRLVDVHDGPLAAWMADSGLTRDEIAMIQGAANIPMRFVVGEPDALLRAEAHGRVQGRIDTATVALRDHTRESLAVAARAKQQSAQGLGHSPVSLTPVLADAAPHALPYVLPSQPQTGE